MSTLTTSREVRMPRRRGLMARALEQPAPAATKDISSIENFNSTISLSKNALSGPTESSISDANETLNRIPSSSEASKLVQKKLKPTLSITFPEEEPPADLLNVSPGVPSPTSDAVRKRRVSKQSSCEMLLNPIQENPQVNEETLLSTQHLRTGFFRTIKKQYPTVAFDNLGINDHSQDSGRGSSIGSPRESNHSLDNTTNSSADYSTNPEKDEEFPFMSSMARKRLRELRKVDPKKVDVATGLQWIRLELHEMREQDKALFLQLIKLHQTIKEIRTEMKFIEENDCPFDSFDSPASYWWPRCNGSSFLPDFSSSDGAHLLTKQTRPMMRRGFSFNQPRSRAMFSPNMAAMNSASSLSFSSSMSSTPGATAL